MQIRRNMTLSCLRRESGQVTPASMMKIARSHLEGTIVEPRWAAPETFWATPCMHDSPQSGYHSAASMVVQLRAELPPLLRQVYWASFSNPCSAVFKPFYLHGPSDTSLLCEGNQQLFRRFALAVGESRQAAVRSESPGAVSDRACLIR